MAEPDVVVIVLQSDGGEALLSELNTEEHPEEPVREALGLFLGVVRDSLQWLVAQPQFAHVQLVESSEHADKSPICVVAASPEAGPDGQVVAGAVKPLLDLQALLTATADCADVFGDKIGYNEEEGVIQIKDSKLEKKVDRLLKGFKPVERLQAALSEEQEQALVDALTSLCPPIPAEEEEEEEEGEEKEPVLEPVHPADLLILLAAYLVDVVGEAPPRVNPLQRIRSLVGGVVGGVTRRARNFRKVVWQVEDLARSGVKLAGRVARKAVRPILLGIMVNRVLKTLDGSRDPEVRMARMTPSQQVDYHMERLLGRNWQKVVEQDFIDAAREVQEGYITDDYLEEKRKVTAAMLRRLEIEDWDKERMKHFYYGSYGLGPWYFDMEERLHNPFFIGARGWNGPIEQWVGKNKRYRDAVPERNADFNAAALDIIETQKGIKLTPEQRLRIQARNQLRTSDVLLGSELLTRVMDKSKLKQALSQ